MHPLTSGGATDSAHLFHQGEFVPDSPMLTNTTAPNVLDLLHGRRDRGGLYEHVVLTRPSGEERDMSMEVDPPQPPVAPFRERRVPISQLFTMTGKLRLTLRYPCGC